MNNPLLNLDTLVVRPCIAIDGKKHPIMSPDEMPVLTSHALASQGRRLDVLMKADQLAPTEQDELRGLVATISDTIMEPIPAAVRAKLSEAQRVDIIQAFTALLLSKRTGTAAALFGGLMPKLAPNLTGANSSPGSVGSTAKPRATGSKKPRSPS